MKTPETKALALPIHEGSGIGRHAIKANSIAEVQESLSQLFAICMGDTPSKGHSMSFNVTTVGGELTIKPISASNGYLKPTEHAIREEKAAFFLAQVLGDCQAQLHIEDDKLSHVGTNGTRTITTDASLVQIGKGMEKVYGKWLNQQARTATLNF